MVNVINKIRFISDKFQFNTNFRAKLQKISENKINESGVLLYSDKIYFFFQFQRINIQTYKRFIF